MLTNFKTESLEFSNYAIQCARTPIHVFSWTC